MPIYDFECETCKKITEQLTSLSTNVITCPACGGTCKKQIGASSFRINGHNASNGYSKLPSIAEKPSWSK